MRAHVGLQDPEMRLSEVEAPLHQLPMSRVSQSLVYRLGGQGQDGGQGRRGEPLSLEAAQKNMKGKGDDKKSGGEGGVSKG